MCKKYYSIHIVKKGYVLISCDVCPSIEVLLYIVYGTRAVLFSLGRSVHRSM